MLKMISKLLSLSLKLLHVKHHLLPTLNKQHFIIIYVNVKKSFRVTPGIVERILNWEGGRGLVGGVEIFVKLFYVCKAPPPPPSQHPQLRRPWPHF